MHKMIQLYCAGNENTSFFTMKNTQKCIFFTKGEAYVYQ